MHSLFCKERKMLLACMQEKEDEWISIKINKQKNLLYSSVWHAITIICKKEKDVFLWE